MNLLYIIILFLSSLLVVAVITATVGSHCIAAYGRRRSLSRRFHSSPPSVVAAVGSLSLPSMFPPSVLPLSLSLQPLFCRRCYYSSLSLLHLQSLLLHLRWLAQSVVGVTVVVGYCGTVIRAQKPLIAEKNENAPHRNFDYEV